MKITVNDFESNPIEDLFLNNASNNPTFNRNTPESLEFIHNKQEYLKFRMKMPLEMKVEYSLNRIRSFYKYYNGDVYVCFSGGKDSVVLLDLVRNIYPKTIGIFADTGVEFPEIKDFIKNGNTNIEIIRPGIKFKEILQKYGYPVISKEQSSYIYEVRKYGRNSKMGQRRLTSNKSGEAYGTISKKWRFLIDAPFVISEKCCEKLKKEPFEIIDKERGIHPFVGLTAAESFLRRNQWVQYGCNIYGEHGAGRPLMFWTEKDVLEYIKIKRLKLSSVYNMGYRRTGCIYCMFGVHLESQNEGITRFERLKITHPKLWKYAISDEGLGLGKIMDYCGLKYGREACNT